MEKLDQSHLHPLLEHPSETYMFRPWFEPRTSFTTGEHSSKELLQQPMLLLFETATFFTIILCNTMRESSTVFSFFSDHRREFTIVLSLQYYIKGAQA